MTAPIKLAITVLTNGFKGKSQIHTAKIGVLACHLKAYLANLFI